MIASILRKELRLSLRSGRLWPLFAAWLLLALLACWASLAAQQRAHAERAAAAQSDQRVWEAQGPRNPHSAAHFGQYAYKPVNTLSALEPGLDAWLGAAIWMEAHYQNPPAQRAAEDLTPLSRMGALSPGWLLAVLLPLTVLVLGFDLFAEERTRGALRLQQAAGASAMALLIGKGLSLIATMMLATAPAWIGALVLAALVDTTPYADGAARLALWGGAYLLWGALWVLLTLAVSAFATSSRLSLAALAGLWLIGVLLLPRLAAEAAEAAHPAPEPAAFWAQVRKAQSEGIDGHNPDDPRAKAFETQVMQQYGVSRMEDLPVSFVGIALQASEEFSNQVYDRSFDAVWSGYTAQAGVQRVLAWLAPVLATRALATQAAGTDLAHHRHFARAAEDHRRTLQRFLNADMTEHGKGKDFDYLAPASLWATAPRLSYAAPPLALPGGALLVLLVWLLAAALTCVSAARRLDSEQAS